MKTRERVDALEFDIAVARHRKVGTPTYQRSPFFVDRLALLGDAVVERRFHVASSVLRVRGPAEQVGEGVFLTL